MTPDRGAAVQTSSGRVPSSPGPLPGRRNSTATANPILIEDIEQMRRREGIDDIELRDGVRALAVGDQVRLTLLAGDDGFAGETVVVRITEIRGAAFSGKLTRRPVAKCLADLPAGLRLDFRAGHIHSILRARPIP